MPMPVFFTPDRDKILRALWMQGKSRIEIRRALGDACTLRIITKRARELNLPRRIGGKQSDEQRAASAAAAKPKRAPPRIVYARIAGCVFIDPHGDGSHCGEGEDQYCARHRPRVAAIPRGPLAQFTVGGLVSAARVTSGRAA